VPSRRVVTPPAGAGAPRDDRGSTSLTTVLLTPVFLAIAFMAFQAAMWSHARTEARAVARDSAALVARNGVSIGDAEVTAQALLETEIDLADPAIEITSDGELVTARVTGRAPGLLKGTSADVDIVVAVPQEGFRP
jgi:Flp pilus assembly protein TadG